MAINLYSQTTGTAGTTTATVNALGTPVTAGDYLFVAVASKPFGSTPTISGGTITGLSQLTTVAAGSTAGGVSIGSPRMTVFYKMLTGSEPANGTVTIANTSGSPTYPLAYHMTADNGFSFTGAPAFQTATDVDLSTTAVSATFGGNLGMLPQDLMLVFMATNDDTNGQFTSETLTVPSCTMQFFGLSYFPTTTGNDACIAFAANQCLSGTQTGASVYSATAPAAASSLAAIVQIRLSEYHLVQRVGKFRAPQ